MTTSPELYGPCPCGSGKKYKFCCRSKDKAAAEQRDKAEAPPLLVRRSEPDIRMGFEDEDDGVPKFATPARREKLDAEAAKLLEFAQPLLEESDGGARDVEDCLLLAKVCAGLALRNLPAQEEQSEIRKLAGRIKMNGEIDARVMGDLIRGMIRRHREMFPEEHARAGKHRDRK